MLLPSTNPSPAAPASIGAIPIVAFIGAFENMSAAPALSAVAHGFATSLAESAWIITAYALAYGAAQLFWGTLAVRLGKRTVLQIGLALAAIGDLLSAFAPSLDALIALRALAGACVGAVIPCAIGLIGDVVPIERRQRSMTDLITGHAAGTAFGILFGGVAA
ncbi:MAG: MFS transporter, partial [Rhodospirillaceae bacterium]|nr:MFS transporter [Rhodospirillaceae bacterium]